MVGFFLGAPLLIDLAISRGIGRVVEMVEHRVGLDRGKSPHAGHIRGLSLGDFTTLRALYFIPRARAHTQPRATRVITRAETPVLKSRRTAKC